MTAPDRRHVPEWLKDVPPDWEIALLRLLARVESGHTPSRNHPEYWVPEECTIPWFSLADIWQLREGRQKYLGDTKEKISPLGMANSAARLLPAGTVALSRTASVGFSGIMPRPMATTQDFVNFVCGKKLLPDFLLWALRGMRSELERLRVGSTHQTIYMPDLLQFRVPVIPLPRQRAIADFLDRNTAAIDALIERKQRLMSLLHEERVALIQNLLTKGLNPSAPMKDSGIVWMGQIPSHWNRRRLKNVLHRIEQGWSPECEQRVASEDEWGVLKAGAVNYGIFREAEHKTLPKHMAPLPELEVHEGDVLMSRASGSPACVGSVALVGAIRPKLLLCDKLFRLHMRDDLVDRSFVASALGSHGVRATIVESSTGQSTLKNIGQDFVSNIVIPVPPVGEQRQIAAQITSIRAKFSATESALQTQLARLAEYRQSLITAAVTGQLPIEASP